MSEKGSERWKDGGMEGWRVGARRESEREEWQIRGIARILDRGAKQKPHKLPTCITCFWNLINS